jgi:hypothetical protein
MQLSEHLFRSVIFHMGNQPVRLQAGGITPAPQPEFAGENGLRAILPDIVHDLCGKSVAKPEPGRQALDRGFSLAFCRLFRGSHLAGTNETPESYG